MDKTDGDINNSRKEMSTIWNLPTYMVFTNYWLGVMKVVIIWFTIRVYGNLGNDVKKNILWENIL